MSRTKQRLRILDLDCECRPLSYWYGDNTTAELTAIAASWVGEQEVHCWALGEVTTLMMLNAFRDLYDQADVLTGHYLRKFDLPLLNGACLEHNLPPLGAKLVSDTKDDLVRRKDLAASQEALGAMYGLAQPKVQMNQADWREANRLTPEGIIKTKARVVGDIQQHKALRLRLIEAKALKPPKVWRP